MSEAAALADRLLLQELLRRHPRWYPRQFAQLIGRSVSWAKDWCRRLRTASDDAAACRRRPPCRTPQFPLSPGRD